MCVSWGHLLWKYLLAQREQLALGCAFRVCDGVELMRRTRVSRMVREGPANDFWLRAAVRQTLVAETMDHEFSIE